MIVRNNLLITARVNAMKVKAEISININIVLHSRSVVVRIFQQGPLHLGPNCKEIKSTDI